MTTIRAGELHDERALFELAREFPTPTPPAADAFAEVLRQKLLDPSACLLVAERDDVPIGYIAGYCHPAFYAGGLTA